MEQFAVLTLFILGLGFGLLSLLSLFARQKLHDREVAALEKAAFAKAAE
jgi:hypothetical protein